MVAVGARADRNSTGDVQAARDFAWAVAVGTTADIEARAAGTVNLATGLIPEPSKAERTLAREDKEAPPPLRLKVALLVVVGAGMKQ